MVLDMYTVYLHSCHNINLSFENTFVKTDWTELENQHKHKSSQ